MRPRGRTWGLALTALACSTAVGLAGMRLGHRRAAGATAGDVAPIGELAGPTVRLDSGGGFDNLLAVTVDTTGEGVTLIAGQVELRSRRVSRGQDRRRRPRGALRRGDPGARRRLDRGRVRLRPRAGRARRRAAGPVDGRVGRDRGALAGRTRWRRVRQRAPARLGPRALGAQRRRPRNASDARQRRRELARLADDDGVRGRRPVADRGSDRLHQAHGRSLRASSWRRESGARRRRTSRRRSMRPPRSTPSLTAARSSPGANVDLLGNVIGGGSADINLVSLISCPCGLETES